MNSQAKQIYINKFTDTSIEYLLQNVHYTSKRYSYQETLLAYITKAFRPTSAVIDRKKQN